MSLNFYYCKGEGFHAVIEEQNENFAAEYFVYLMNEILEPEKGITIKDVICEAVNVYNYKREEIAGACQTCQDNDFSMGDYCPECGKRHVQS